MLDYENIKQLARSIKRPVRELLALAPVNDPFYAGVDHRREAAEWFKALWHNYGRNGTHIRRFHYQLVSPPEGVRILLPDGREYENTEGHWSYLCAASLGARYLGLVPFDGLVDRRNDEPMIFAATASSSADRAAVNTHVVGGVDVDIPDLPILPFYSSPKIPTVQDFILEVWIEKSTQNDWLVPLCRRRGVNLVVGIGEQSETRSRELALRSAKCDVPVRIIYLSDFDPAGRSMPKAVARKVEFTICRFDLKVDVQIIPLVLTPDQCRQYRLPRTPIKDSEKRKDKFEKIFGVGATELDALEALYPGEMGQLLEAEINNWLDPDLEGRVANVRSDIARRLLMIEEAVEKRYAEEVEGVADRLSEVVAELEAWERTSTELWEKIEAELEEQRPDLSDVKIPKSEAPGKTGRFVLFDSGRGYLTQMDAYNAWRDGDAP